ncbi:MAG: hypothetical protein JXR84_15235 [Anaerolineae bacterium]|nr:hypothetical protein [Anaerolineae bacterium]
MFERWVADDTVVRVQDGGMIEIWNFLDDGVKASVGVRYDAMVPLLKALREAQENVYEMIWHECQSVEFLVLEVAEIAVRDFVEDVVMLRVGVERGTVHEILNRLHENNISFRRDDDHRWVWTCPGKAKPELSDYPEIGIALRRRQEVAHDGGRR